MLLVGSGSDRNRSAACVSLVNSGCLPILAASLQRSLVDMDNQRLPSDSTVDITGSILVTFGCMLEHYDGCRDAFSAARCFQVTLDAMRRWSDCYNIQMAAYKVLSFVYPSRDHVIDAIIEGGGIELILKAEELFLRSKTEESRVGSLEAAMVALRDLSKDNLNAMTSFQRAEGVSVIVEVLQEPFSNAARGTHAASLTLLRFYMDMVFAHHEDKALIVSKMIGCGTIPTVLFSMQKFPNNAAIQRMGCMLLAKLASTEEGAISVVINGGKRIIERGGVQYEAKQVLERIKRVDTVDRCHKCHAASDRLMQCGRCNKVLYCSKDCQRNGYNPHKRLCKQMANRANST